MTKEAMKLALEALELNDAPLNNEAVVLWEQKIDEAIIALREALTSVPDWASEAIKQPAQQELVGVKWTPCMKLPMVVHVRKQRPGESHVSTREGITPVKPDDLIMRGVSGEEYPIGRVIFEQTYSLDTSPPTLSLAQRTWVGLTDEDKAEIKKQANYNWETTTGEYASKVQALTEAKLKEKNNGN